MTSTADPHAARCALLHPDAPAAIEATKQAILPILVAHAIDRVVISYDGYGDEGQIETVTGFDAAGEAVELPGVPCPRHDSAFRGGVTASDATLPDALETLGYEVLADSFAGWENNDGALGEMTLDVARGVITLEHSWRVMTLERVEWTL